MAEKNSISLIVSSCDSYSDLWIMFANTFNECFPEFSGEKWLLSNNKTFDYNGFSSLRVGEDISWSSNLSLALREITTEYVLLALDDLFLKEKVDNKLFEKVFYDFVSLNGNYLKMIVAPKSSVSSESIYFNVLEKGSLYRSTAVLTIWRVSVLKEILVDNESAWEFEEKSALRSDNYEGFYVVRKNFFSTLHMVVRGKILKKSIKELNQLVPGWRKYTTRKVQTKREALRQVYKDFRHYIFTTLIPARFRRKLKVYFS